MGKKLQMSLKKQWFEMTKAGIKTEDYRELTSYWTKRLVNDRSHNIAIGFHTLEGWVNDKIQRGFKPFTVNRMTLDYPKGDDQERIIEFEHAGIEIREGNPEWGAEKGKMYFVIKHGKRIK